MKSTVYKGRPAIRIESSVLSAIFLPEDGGKMASLSDGKREYLAQAAGKEYMILGPKTQYASAECSGFDDMFPTIDPYIPADGAFSGKEYPDHGEVCRYPMETVVSNDKVTFCFSSSIFPVTFSKTVFAGPDGSIMLQYRICNVGGQPFPYIWAAHCMLAGAADGTIVTPFPDEEPIRMMFGSALDSVLSRKALTDFSSADSTYKFYYIKPNTEGYCGYRYADSEVTLLMQYTADIIPYLGIWLNNGGFKGMYNIALEPCTAPFDRPDVAQKAGCESVIAAHSEISFELRFVLQREEKNHN